MKTEVDKTLTEKLKKRIRSMSGAADEFTSIGFPSQIITAFVT